MITKDEILAVLKPENYIGMAPVQVEDFIKNEVAPVIEKYGNIRMGAEITV